VNDKRAKNTIAIKNGKIVNGTGKPSFKSDILISNRIIKIGKINSAVCKVIDAEGLTISPGFINIHDHSDSTLLADGKAKSLVMQGVTTTVIGNCGYSLAPINDKTIDILLGNWLFPMPNIEIDWRGFSDYLLKLEQIELSINVVTLVGHGTIRIAVLGMDNREPSKDELDEMKRLTYDAMVSGAFGLSSGLAYPPGCYAKTQEIVELCKEVARFNGVYSTHTRKEAYGYLDGIKEAIEIGEKSNVRVQISHIETHYPAWGEQDEALNLVSLAKSKGLDVSCDAIPYLWSATSLYTLVPKWIYEGGHEEIVKRMKDEEVRKKVKEEILSSRPEVSTLALAKDGLWDKIKILSCPKKKEFEGKTIAEISNIVSKEPFDVVFDLLSLGPPFPSIMAQSHNEDDIRKAVKFKHTMIQSDLYTLPSDGLEKDSFQHPRGFGTFPLLFRKYVRGETREDLPEEKGERILSLEEAVKKVTSLPAKKLRLRDRGIIKEGMFADIVIFDENKIQDLATYKNPNLYPKGIEYVIVNGEIVVDRGKHTNFTPGKVIRKANKVI
jgi:N-acyl-D-amino-acid deacylase